MCLQIPGKALHCLACGPAAAGDKGGSAIQYSSGRDKVGIVRLIGENRVNMLFDLMDKIGPVASTLPLPTSFLADRPNVTSGSNIMGTPEDAQRVFKVFDEKVSGVEWCLLVCPSLVLAWCHVNYACLHAWWLELSNAMHHVYFLFIVAYPLA